MLLDTEDIVGYQVCVETKSSIVNCVTDWIDDNKRDCRYFSCLNPHAAQMATRDRVFHDSFLAADIITPDGIGVIYASKMLGGQLSKRVTGMDVFLGVSEAMNRRRRGSCFFLGSTEETLAKMRARMAENFPHVKVSGEYSPPFKPQFSPQDDQAMIDAVNASGADVLWVGLTAPKQENWLYSNQDKLSVNFAGPIGAAFDFFVGNIGRAGPFWQDLGLEWLPRLAQEPRRLWRRSLVSAPEFFWRTIRYRLARPRQV